MVDFYHRYFVHGAIALMCLAVIGGVVIVSMLSGLDEVPTWWIDREGVRPGDALVIEQAERVENAITTQLTALRDPQDPHWNTKVSDQQANAWLGVRLRDTIITHMGEDAWDDRVERVIVRFEEGGVTIGARIHHSAGSSIVSARAQLELDMHGELWARIGSVHVGTTRVPAWVINAAGQDDVHIGRIRLGPGAMELGDGRVAILRAIRTRDEWIDVAVETAIVSD
jgi:hypothetical protein